MPEEQQPHIRQTADGQEILDIIRRRYVALTPEEGVRQAVIRYLHDKKGYPLELMQVEGTITLNGMSRRCDIVVYDKAMTAKMIVECKRPDVAITQKVADQACRYNTVLQVPWLLLTNGKQSIMVEIENGVLKQCEIPSWETINNS